MTGWRAAAALLLMAFAVGGCSGLFGMAFPTTNPVIAVKGSLPQTFLDITAKQAERLR